MNKINGKELKTPGDFMDFTKTDEGSKYVDNADYCKKDQRTHSTVFVETGYGWFWIDFKFESYSDSFIESREKALEDLKVFQKSNSV